jgi:ABC-2 type transport system ATP-binding protein
MAEVSPAPEWAFCPRRWPAFPADARPLSAAGGERVIVPKLAILTCISTHLVEYQSTMTPVTATATPTATKNAPQARDGASRVAMIEADGLTKFYGDFAACRDVSFAINRGEVAAFLGPNGAGKSTTMKLLTGYLAPSGGTARVAGFNMSTHRLDGAKRLGYLPENGPLYPEMTPRALLKFFGTARGLSRQQLDERMEKVIQLCRLGSVIGKPIGKLSKGFRQRVGMAQVLLHEPDVLIMDEPTAGLDPNQIREVRETIRRLGETKTILLSTHILQEVEAMCNRVIFINEGRVVFDGTPTAFAADDKDIAKRFHQLSS